MYAGLTAAEFFLIYDGFEKMFKPIVAPLLFFYR